MVKTTLFDVSVLDGRLGFDFGGAREQAQFSGVGDQLKSCSDSVRGHINCGHLNPP